MGIDIDKLSMSSYVPKELSEINKLSSKSVETESEAENVSIKNQDENNTDTYKKSSPVTDSIERQIKEQEAKIKEISDNLAVLLENYNETAASEDDARTLRYQKSRDLHGKELTENSLKSVYEDWTAQYNADKTDSSIKKEYALSNMEYEDANLERIEADKAYDIADTDAYEKIQAHNVSSSQYLMGLSGKRNAYYDLASLQRSLGIAKIKESLDQ